MTKKKVKEKRSAILTLSGLAALLISIAVAVLLYSLRFDELWRWYDEYRSVLKGFENKIVCIDKNWEFFGIIFFLYLLKTFIPLYPISTVCFLTGVVLPLYIAIPINFFGFALEFIIKYYLGKKFGAGSSWYFIRKFEPLVRLLKTEGKGNIILLTSLRLMPFMPINPISAVYGSMNYGFCKYLALSLIGVIPRIVSFTIVGRNSFDPLSPSFLLPIMMITFVIGVTTLSVNGIWNIVEKEISKYKNKNKGINYE